MDAEAKSRPELISGAFSGRQHYFLPVLTPYLRQFERLKVAKVGGMPAPHKPLLLLAIMRLVKQDDIGTTKWATKELVGQHNNNGGSHKSIQTNSVMTN